MKNAYKKYETKNEIREIASDRIEKISALLKELEQKNNGYQKNFLKNEITWPQIGDMAHIIDLLEQLTGKRG